MIKISQVTNIFILLSLTATGIKAKRQIMKGPKKLKISLRNETNHIQVARMFLGGSKVYKSKPKEAFFKFDINGHNVIIQRANNFTCTVEDGCTIPSTITSNITFRKQRIEGLLIVPKLNFDPILSESSIQAFLPGPQTPPNTFEPNVNYIGLAPHSAFWDYLENHYDFQDASGGNKGEDIELSIVYGISPNDPKFYQKKFNYDDSFEKSFITLNGQSYGPRETSKKVMIGETKEVDFIFRGYEILGLDQDITKGLNLCITNTANFLIAVKDPEKAKKSIFKKLCGNENICRKYNSYVDKIDPIVLLSPEGKKISISQTEFIHVIDNHKVDLSIDDLSKFSNSSCPIGTNVALGIQFLATNEVSIIKKRNYKKFQWFVSKIKVSDNPTFKYLAKDTLEFANFILEIAIWVILALFLVYVFIVKKKLGIKSRVIKDTTRYQPYLFSPSGAEEEEFV